MTSDSHVSRFATPAFQVPVLFFLFLGFVLYEKHGQYHTVYILLLFILFAWVVKTQIHGFDKSKITHNLLLSGLAFFALCLCIFKRGLIFATDDSTLRLLLKGNAVLLVAFILVCTSMKAGLHKNRILFAISMATFLGLFVAKVLVLQASPNPQIDVFVTTTAALKHLIAGLNPYVQEYTDIYRGNLGYRPTFGYWPGLFPWLAPAFAVFGDFRVAYLVADLGTLFLLIAVIRQLQLPKFFEHLFPLLWFSFPVSYFVLEQAWTESILNFYLILLVWSLLGEKWVVAGISIGMLCATKQYGVYVGWLTVIFLGTKDRRSVRPLLVSGIFTFLIIMLPFVFWNVSGFYSSTVTTLLRMRLRIDLLSLPALFARKLNFWTPGWLLIVANMVSLLAVSIWLKRFPSVDILRLIQALFFIYGMTFLFGKQGACNYYFYLAFLALIMTIFIIHKKSALQNSAHP